MGLFRINAYDKVELMNHAERVAYEAERRMVDRMNEDRKERGLPLIPPPVPPRTWAAL